MSFCLWLCEPRAAPVLLEELKRTFPRASHAPRGEGLLESHLGHEGMPPSPPFIAFARQVLPDVVRVDSPAVGPMAELLWATIAYTFQELEAPWRLHVFDLQTLSTPGRSRADLLKERLLETLKSQSRSLFHRLEKGTEPSRSTCRLVQVLLETPTTAWVSFAELTDLAGRMGLSRFTKGSPGCQLPALAPSKAGEKLLEAQAHLGRFIGPSENCIDLGASPGGWTYIALEQGASVLGVDRSPLRADLMTHPRFSFRKGDAFKVPPERVDWLLCDVIAAPQRSVDLLLRWLEAEACDAFCVTLKFKGKPEIDILDTLKQKLTFWPGVALIRQLSCNKNEVTVLGCRRGIAADAPRAPAI